MSVLLSGRVSGWLRTLEIVISVPTYSLVEGENVGRHRRISMRLLLRVGSSREWTDLSGFRRRTADRPSSKVFLAEDYSGEGFYMRTY